MKKLSLKKLKLEANDMLQRNQLKTVFGGYGGEGTCIVDECTSNSDCTSGHPSCTSFSCTKDDGTKSSYKYCM